MRKIAEMFYEIYKKENGGCTYEISEEFFDKERKLLKSFTKDQFLTYSEIEILQDDQKMSIEIKAMEFLLNLICPKE